MTGLPFEIQIPEIKSGEIMLSGNINEHDLTLYLSNISVKSSLIEVQGDGSLSFMPDGKAENGKVVLTGTASKEGFKELGDGLKLLSNGRINGAGQKFKATLSGPFNSAIPNFTLTPANEAEGL
jgi:hypothetical protein